MDGGRNQGPKTSAWALDEGDWKDCASMLALLREKVPATLWYDVDPEQEEERG